MKSLQKLFELSPKIREIFAHNSERHLNQEITKLFNQEIPDFEQRLGDAFTAYSQQGFLASPQVNDMRKHRPTFFDWTLINLVRRSHLTATNHQLISMETSVFFIQYMISGGFKNPAIGMNNEELRDEFAEAYAFVQSCRK